MTEAWWESVNVSYEILLPLVPIGRREGLLSDLIDSARDSGRSENSICGLAETYLAGLRVEAGLD